MGGLISKLFSKSPEFSTWEDVTTTKVKIQFPKSDAALRKLLSKAASDSKKVRVMGATHSAAGLVTSGKDANGTPNPEKQVVISLDRYTPSTEGWRDITIDEAKGTVRVPAGRSLLDLYAVIRPRDYFLPTQTAGWFFTVGGVIGTCVHGGVFGADMLNRYVTSVLVMNADGSIVHVDDEEELRYYRCGFGLLGVVLAVEFTLVKRERFQVDDTLETLDWTEANFNKYIQRVRDRAIYAEFFMSFLDPAVAEVAAVEFYDGDNGEPVNTSKVKLAYAVQKKLYKNISVEGDPVLDLAIGMEGLDLTKQNSRRSVRTLIRTTMFGIKLYSEVSYRGTNDGHWVRLSVGAAIAAYYIPVAHAFQAIDAYRTVFRRRYDSKDEELFKINQPCEFRYVNIQPNGPILFDIPPGEYCVMEFLSFTGNEQNKIYSAMKELEDKLVAMGAYPHTAKIFGLTETPDGKVQAFNRAFFTKTSSAKGRDAFRQKQLALDPNGVFLTPHASWFLDE